MNNNALPTTGDNTDSKDPRAGWPRRCPGGTTRGRVRRIPSAIPISFSGTRRRRRVHRVTRQASPMGISSTSRGAIYIRMIDSTRCRRLYVAEVIRRRCPEPPIYFLTVASRDNKYWMSEGRKCKRAIGDHFIPRRNPSGVRSGRYNYPSTSSPAADTRQIPRAVGRVVDDVDDIGRSFGGSKFNQFSRAAGDVRNAPFTVRFGRFALGLAIKEREES